MNKITLQPEPTLQTLMESTAPESMDYIAGLVFPAVNSPTLTGNFGRLDEGAMRIVSTAVIGLAHNVVNYKFDHNATFSVTNQELENVITATDAERLGGWDAAKEIISMLLYDNLLKSRENSIAAALTSTSVMTRNTTLLTTDKWSTKTSNVLSVIKSAKDSIAQYTGKIANTVILGYPVFSALQVHPEIYSVLWPGKNLNPGLITDGQLANALGVDRVLVGRSTYNSAKEGQAGVPAFIWGKNAVVAYISPSAKARFSATLGAQIVCPGKMPVQYVGSYEPEGKQPNQVQVLKSGANYEDKIINVNAGYLIALASA